MSRLFKFIFVFICLQLISSCSPNNVSENKEADTVFTQNQLNGCFAFFDNSQGMFSIHNLNSYKDSAYHPAQLLHDELALIGLQTGIINNEKSTLQSLTPNTPIDTALQHISFTQAFTGKAANEYFNTVKQLLGKDSLQQGLDSLHYGKGKAVLTENRNIDLTSIRITPDEQLGFIKNLYFGKLPFQKRVQEIVKKSLIRENNANYQLAYRISITNINSGLAQYWAEGWIEENKHPYFFVMQATSAKQFSEADVLTNILKPILKNKGFFEGKR